MISGLTEATENCFKLVMKNYFSPEEYKVGDTILIRNVSITDNTINSGFKQFLEKQSGHIIIALEDSNNGSNKTFVNTIIIGCKTTIDHSTGSISLDTFGNISLAENIIDGTLINLNNQHLIKLSIETEHYEDNFKSKLL